jgi:hypothetical protein
VLTTQRGYASYRHMETGPESLLGSSTTPLVQSTPERNVRSQLAGPQLPNSITPLPRPGQSRPILPLWSPTAVAQGKNAAPKKTPSDPSDQNDQRSDQSDPTSEAKKPSGGPSGEEATEQIKLMRPLAWVSVHPFAATLHEWEDGVPVNCGTDWSTEAIELAIEKGAHRSALNSESIALVTSDIDYQVKAGFARIVLWDDVKSSPPAKLKVSPLAVVPQRNRRGRMILDLSFPVHRSLPSTKSKRKPRKLGAVLQPAVNDTTHPSAPTKPVKEIGTVLPRMFEFMAAAPSKEHVLFSKIDLSDGFWRMFVSAEDSWNFAYVFPAVPGEPIRLVIPNALQMGWTESPAIFCSATETTRDLVQMLVDSEIDLPEHPMEASFAPSRPAKRLQDDSEQWQMSGVYVDDFILAAIENKDGSLLLRTTRSALHGIHSIFPPPSRSGHSSGKDPVSEKKLAKGDGTWATTKEILGFEFDGIARTVRVPKDKADDIVAELRRLITKKHAPLKAIQQIAGKLRHVSNILPSARSLFTPLNRAMAGATMNVGLGAKSEICAALRDFIVLVRDLAARPTHVRELIDGPDGYVGYCDASASGAGGVWFSGSRAVAPTVWRVTWPPDITQDLVSFDNPNGCITNSDLEMAGVCLHQLVLETLVDLKHVRSVIHCDNSPSVAWVTRMASRSTSPVAHRLLRGLAMRQRVTQSAPPTVVSIAGVENDLADVASRAPEKMGSVLRGDAVSPLFAHTKFPDVSDEGFLTFFNQRFPLPQESLWQLAHPEPEMLSNVISTLRGHRLILQRWTTPPARPAGANGTSIPRKHASSPTCEPVTDTASNSSSWPLPPGFELDSSGRNGRLVTSPSKKPSVTWRKPSFWPDTQTPVAPTDLTSSTLLSDIS